MGADCVSAMLCGNISRKTVPNMNPDPNAMKYRSDETAHLPVVTMIPPMTLANAAATAKRRDWESGLIRCVVWS